MTDDTLSRIRTAINAEIEELHCNSGEHSYDVQVNAIMIVEGLRRALRIVEEIFLKDGEVHCTHGWTLTEKWIDEHQERYKAAQKAEYERIDRIGRDE